MVFVAPTRKRKPFLPWGIISEPIVAEWPELIAGRKATSGEEIISAISALKNSFFGIFILFNGLMCCFGIFEFVLSEIISAERPNNPERRGIRGSFTGRLKVRKPRRPASEKTMKEINGFSSLKIR